jgi:hypothetical protein
METTSERGRPDESRRQAKPRRLPERTPEEQSVLDQVVRTHGAAWVERHAELILEQARFIGNL